MSKKAVYNNKGLAIYITGDEFKDLLEMKSLDVPAYIGTARVPDGFVTVKMLLVAGEYLGEAYQLEHEAIEAARTDYIKNPTRYSTYEETHGDKKNG